MAVPHPRDVMRDDMHKMLLQLPVKVFMFSLDQISTMLDIDPAYFHHKMVYYQGRTRRRKTQSDIVARNLAMPDDPPIWRIDEHELIRWLKFKKIKFYAPRRVNAHVN